MADLEISAATSAAPAALTDVIPIARVGVALPRSLTVQDILALATMSRNLLINGNFVINQEAYVSGAALATGSYGHDGWKAGAAGGDYTFAQLNNSTVITIQAGKTLIQVVENKMVEGGSYTLSWTGTAQARYAVNSATPAGAYAASPIAIAGQTAGTTMSVEFNAGTLGEVMLAPGTAAAPFERRPYPLELALCLRYYARLGNLTQAEIEVRGYGNIGEALASYVPFKVPMRATPTLTRIGNFTVSNMAQPTAVGGTVNGFQLTAALNSTGSGYCLSETNAYFEAKARL